ncbi:MAG: sialate O-acetylesterase [Bacteroidia bacterium]|nr:sialate O-acetylesterase [Bacteroidia bacterium]
MKPGSLCIILVALMSLFSGSLQAQSHELIRRDYGVSGTHVEIANALTATPDFGYVVAGEWGDSAFLMKFNCMGDTLWRNYYYKGSGIAGFSGVVSRLNGELVAGGFCTHCAPGDTLHKTWVVRTDSLGNMLQDTAVGDSGKYVNSSDIHTTQDGGFILTGETNRGGLFAYSDHLIKLDSNLSPEWIKYYDGSFFDEANGVTQTADGGYAFIGTSVLFGGNADIHVFRTDSAGTVLWHRVIGGTPPLAGNTEGKDIVLDKNGNLVLTGMVYVDSLRKQDILVMRLDVQSGVTMDSVHYGSAENDIANSIAAKSDGGFLIAGVWGIPLNQGSGWPSWVMVLDANLDSSTSYKYDFFLLTSNLKAILPVPGDSVTFVAAGVRHFFALHNVEFIMQKLPDVCGPVTFTSAARHLQFYPRNPLTNKAQIHITGSVDENNPGFSAIELKIFKDNQFLQSQTQALAYASGKASFDFPITLDGGLFEYRFEIAGTNVADNFPVTTMDRIVVGDAWIIQGQSNAVAGQVDTLDPAGANNSPFIRVFGSGSDDSEIVENDRNWYIADGDVFRLSPGHTGQWGIKLARQIIDNHQMPVALLNGAHGGQPISFFQRDDAFPENTETNYGRLYFRAEESGLRDSVRGIFWYQGESDTYMGGPTLDQYKDDFYSLYDDWKEDYPSAKNFYLFQIRNGCFAPVDSSLKIMEAQRQLADELADLQIMSTTAISHHTDGCHFPFTNGYEVLGNRIYRLVAQDFYNMPADAANEAPVVVEAHLLSGGQLALKVANVGTGLSWDTGAEQDFRLEGTTATITSGTAFADTILLTLQGNVNTPLGISYLGHPGATGPWVTDGLGIGLVCFRDLPVEDKTTAIDADMLKEFLIYPNPTTGNLFIGGKNVGEFQVKLMDMHSKIILEKSFSQGTHVLDISRFSPGLYIVEIQSGARVGRTKVLLGL